MVSFLDKRRRLKWSRFWYRVFRNRPNDAYWYGRGLTNHLNRFMKDPFYRAKVMTRNFRTRGLYNSSKRRKLTYRYYPVSKK